MARRKARRKRTESDTPMIGELNKKKETTFDEVEAPASEPVAPARILIVEPDAGSRARVAELLRASEMICDPVATLLEARGAIAGAHYDAAIVNAALPDGSGLDIPREFDQNNSTTRVIISASAPTLDLAVLAMRTGAMDLLAQPFEEAQLVASVRTAVERSRNIHEQERRVERLKRICRRLNTARRQVTNQVNSLCNDLVGAYQELSDQVGQVALASEFGSLIQQELDIEELLRTGLEYMLTKTGPTNAAVFLPSNHSDFSLGAYVNYDCPRDTADVLLDHLADVIAPRFQDEEMVHHFTGDNELSSWIGDDASWLAESDVVVFTARHEGECLAVCVFFRDGASPYSEELVSQLGTLGDLFGQQLAKIVNIHHRHMPDKQWSGWDDWDEEEEGDDYGGLAA